MSHENTFVARKAYFLAVAIKDKYELDELPKIRWLASYKIWGLAGLCSFVLYVLWRIAVILAALFTSPSL